MFRSFLDNRIIHDTKSYTIHTHVSRRLINRFFTSNFFNNTFDYREGFNISIIIYSYFIVGVKVEGIDHIDILQIDCGCFIGNVQWMFQRNVPYWKSFELGVASCMSFLAFMIQLVQTSSEFAASWSRSCHYNDWFSCFNVFVFPKPIFRNDFFYVDWIVFDC